MDNARFEAEGFEPREISEKRKRRMQKTQKSSTKTKLAKRSINRSLSEVMTKLSRIYSTTDIPRIISSSTEMAENCRGDVLAYMATIEISANSRKEALYLKKNIEEKVLLPMKRCFVGIHEDVPSGILETYRECTGKHARMGISYLVSVKDDGLRIDFRRSMDDSGAHRLHKVTDQDYGKKGDDIVEYEGKLYHAVPMAVREANHMVAVLSAMVDEAIGNYLVQYAKDLYETSPVPAEQLLLVSAIVDQICYN